MASDQELLSELRTLYGRGDDSLLFAWAAGLLGARVASVQWCLAMDDGRVERAQIDWADRLADESPLPRRAVEAPPDTAALLGLVLALAGRFSDADPRSSARVEAMAVVVSESMGPLVAGARFWIVRRTSAPLLVDLAEGRRLPRTNRDVAFDLAEELNLPVRLLWEPASIQVRVLRLPAVVDDRLRARAGGLRVGLGLPRTALTFAAVRPASSFKPFGTRCLGHDQASAAQEEIASIATAILAERVDVLLLPELSMNEALRQALVAALAAAPPDERPVVLVLGSEHVQDGDGFVNRAIAVDAKGRVLWTQDKCRLLRVTGPIEAVEEIRCAEVVTLVDGCLGRMASPICLDYIHEDLLPIWVDGAIRLMLVPAFSASLEDFRVRARELGRRAQTVTVVCNHPQLVSAAKAAQPGARGFLYLPAHAPAHLEEVPADREALCVLSTREILNT